jgi:hypothetical protein
MQKVIALPRGGVQISERGIYAASPFTGNLGHNLPRATIDAREISDTLSGLL